MNGEQLVDRIKSTGYWRVVIRPSLFDRHRLSQLSDCWELVESNRVRLRGWDFPHIDWDYRTNMDDWIESAVDWRDIKEYWRLHQSGQFVHYSAFMEDYNQVPWSSSEYEDGKPRKYLEITSTLYRLTEVFEFAARLASKDVLSPQAVVSITMFATDGRDLVFWEGSRFLAGRYVCRLPQIRFEGTYDQKELISSAVDIALAAAIHVYERFNWPDPPKQILAEDQRSLLKRRV